MTELKTLKDFAPYNITCCDMTLEKVKKEAIKWVKKIMDMAEKGKRPDSLDMFGEFFNITEDDLKLKGGIRK